MANALLESLCAVRADGYGQVCHALSQFDVRDHLDRIATPLLVIGGEDDIATPPESQQQLANGVRDGRLEMMPKAGHLAPAEGPEKVAGLIADFLG